MDYNQLAIDLHKQHKGKITTALRDQSELDRAKLSAYYSPGVGQISRDIADDPSLLPEYTWTNNLVAVISDGSAILGLGDLQMPRKRPMPLRLQEGEVNILTE